MRLPRIDKVRGFALVVILLVGAVSGRGGVELNEVMPVDKSVLMDEDGDYPGWVELVNSGSESIDLGGYGLSDDPRDLFKWVFPSVRVEPGRTLIVFTSGKNRCVPPGASTCLTNSPIV
ncbi:MAG: lamin tail domain-containing protein, partial [Verrucomicrobiia bacterium]